MRFEVWVYDAVDGWRFNACFDTADRTGIELSWYRNQGYDTEVRLRTTRHQRPEYVTTGRKL